MSRRDRLASLVVPTALYYRVVMWGAHWRRIGAILVCQADTGIEICVAVAYVGGVCDTFVGGSTCQRVLCTTYGHAELFVVQVPIAAVAAVGDRFLVVRICSTYVLTCGAERAAAAECTRSWRH